LTASVEEYVARLQAAQAAVVRVLCDVIRGVAPAAHEWAQPVWVVNGPVCSVKAFKNYTNINFWRGAEFAECRDSDHLLRVEGGQMRHIRVPTVDEIRAEPIQNLVRSAIELNERFGNPTLGTARRARD
jgi:hypothetical protein